jgi:hypothetical protein
MNLIVPQIFHFLLGGRRYSNRNVTEWKNLCNCQIKSSNLSETPFLVKTAVLLNLIMPVVSGLQWSLINKHSTKVTNADKTVRRVRSTSDHISDHITQPKGIEILLPLREVKCNNISLKFYF